MKNETRRTQFSKLVVQSKEQSVDALTSAHRHAETVDKSAKAFFARALPPGWTMPNFYVLQVLIGIIFRQDLDLLLKADLRNNAEIRDNSKVRLVRDEERTKVLQALIGIRDSFDSIFGVGMCQRYLSLGIMMPEKPWEVLQVALQVLDELTSPKFALPEPDKRRVSGVHFRPDEWVEELLPHVERLGDSLLRLSSERRDTDGTQEVKNVELDNLRRNFVRCARLLEALYEVAGHPHLAKRLRPAIRAFSKRSEETTDDGEPSGEPSSGDETRPDSETSAEEAADVTPPVAGALPPASSAS